MKFKRDDKVWFHDQKAEVTAVVMEAAKSYAVAYKTPKGKIRHTTTVEGQLEIRKDIYSLEEGDKVIDHRGRLLKIKGSFDLSYTVEPVFGFSAIEYITPSFINKIVRDDGERYTHTIEEMCY